MKRKGLIVSSIVMVIVLIASLTTATYAWFSASSTAKIDQITVQTVAAKGLQIGAIKYPAAGSPVLELSSLIYSSLLEYGDDGIVTSDSSIGGGGTNVSFKMSENKAFYSVTGNGLVNNTWAAYGISGEGAERVYVENHNGSIVDDDAVYVGTATQASYFYQDFLVVNTDNNTDLLKIKSITVAPAFATKQTDLGKLIAASTRIAVYTKGTSVDEATAKTYTETEEKTMFDTTGLRCYIEPWGKTQKNANGVIDNEKLSFDTDTYYINADKAVEVDGAGPLTKSLYTQVPGGSTALTAPKCVKYTDWTGAKNVAKGKDVALGTVHAGGGTYDYFQNGDAKFKTFTVTPTKDLGAFTVGNQYMPVRIAIWFEGEDAECLTAYAQGSGIKISVEFEKVAAK